MTGPPRRQHTRDRDDGFAWLELAWQWPAQGCEGFPEGMTLGVVPGRAVPSKWRRAIRGWQWACCVCVPAPVLTASPQRGVCGVSIAQLQLERVLGMTCVHNSSLAVNNVTGEIAYPAGCIVVVYNPKRNRQVRLVHACCDGA